MWGALSATYSGVEIQNSHGGWHVFSLDDAYVYRAGSKTAGRALGTEPFRYYPH